MDSDRKVFVGGLTSNTTEDDMKAYFGGFGEVTDVLMNCFVTFSDPKMANTVVSTEDHIICGKPVEVKMAKECSKPDEKTGRIFVGGLSWETDENMLREYFSQFGEVFEVHLKKDKATGRSRGFGFVTMDELGASKAVDKRGEIIIDGKKVEVKFVDGTAGSGDNNKEDDGSRGGYGGPGRGGYGGPRGGGYAGPGRGGYGDPGRGGYWDQSGGGYGGDSNTGGYEGDSSRGGYGGPSGGGYGGPSGGGYGGPSGGGYGGDSNTGGYEGDSSRGGYGGPGRGGYGGSGRGGYGGN